MTFFADNAFKAGVRARAYWRMAKELKAEIESERKIVHFDPVMRLGHIEIMQTLHEQLAEAERLHDEYLLKHRLNPAFGRGYGPSEAQESTG